MEGARYAAKKMRANIKRRMQERQRLRENNIHRVQTQPSERAVWDKHFAVIYCMIRISPSSLCLQLPIHSQHEMQKEVA